ncbi:hypothetical protein SK128_025119, partial [Halocaridina rubra]
TAPVGDLSSEPDYIGVVATGLAPVDLVFTGPDLTVYADSPSHVEVVYTGPDHNGVYVKGLL